MGEGPFHQVNQAGAVSISPVSLKVTAKSLEIVGVPSSVLTEGRAAVDTGQVALAIKVTLCGHKPSIEFSLGP